jgi:hypothetical protein
MSGCYLNCSEMKTTLVGKAVTHWVEQGFGAGEEPIEYLHERTPPNLPQVWGWRMMIKYRDKVKKK